MKCRRFCFFALLASIAAADSHASAAEILVPGDYTTIQAAMDAALDGDEVILVDAMYSGFGNKDLVRNFDTTFTVRSASGDPSRCVIDCEEFGRGFLFGTGKTSDFRVEGITIRNGAAATGGGMVFVNNSNTTVVNCVFESNQAFASGGGIFCVDSEPLITGCVFRANVSEFDGGAINCGIDAAPRLIDCRFIDNVAADRGGAVFGVQSDPSFINCEFVGNRSNGETTSGGGAMTFTIDALSFVANCSFTGNTAAGAGALGGAIATLSGSSVVVANSILWSNLPDEVLEDGGGLVAGHSLIRGGWPGVGNIGEDLVAHDPLFADEKAGDLQLRPGSAAIDAGNNFALDPSVETDLAGAPRYHDDPGVRDTGVGADGDPLVDMGAFEFQGTSVECMGDVDGDGNRGFFDLVSVLSFWGPCPGCPEDLDGSGTVGFTDLLTVLSYWGPCPER